MPTGYPQSMPEPGSVDETRSLISSLKVEGTPVVRSDGERVGSIDHMMIDKRSGHVEYAVMSFGGFLGLGESYYAIPWRQLRYNPSLDGYEINLTDDQLRGAPSSARAEDMDWTDAEYGRRVRSYYELIPPAL